MTDGFLNLDSLGDDGEFDPSQLLAAASAIAPTLRPYTTATGSQFEGLDGIPSGDGMHRSALLQLTHFVRSRWMLTPSAAVRVARALLSCGVFEGYNLADPFTDDDLDLMARRVRPAFHLDAAEGVAYAQTDGESTDDEVHIGSTSDSLLGTVAELALFDRPIEWLLHRYVPFAALSMLYGEGKVGKSTFAAFLASLALLGGKNVLFIGAGEETPEMFHAKVLASVGRPLGASDGTFYFLKMPNMALPRHAEALRSLIADASIGFVYLDAWRSHIDHSGSSHEADMTRTVLTPLSHIAHDYGPAIVCTTHENAAGNLLGSTEVANVARVVLHITADQSGVRHLRVKRTNMPSPPTAALRFKIEGRPMVDAQGNVAQERLPDGTLAPFDMGTVLTYEEQSHEEVVVDDVTSESDPERIARQIRELRSVDPSVQMTTVMASIPGALALKRALYLRDVSTYPE
jgi:hypothetical protein